MSRLLAEAQGDAPVLVAVLTHPIDLQRALNEGWYRIPLNRAPQRIGAEFLAFYHTGAFDEGERWQVRYYAPVRGYFVATRRDLIPTEPDHPRASDRYYRVDLGPLELLPRPVPSRRLRRITFIPTTVERLLAAREINDLWLHTPAQERLWRAFQEAGLADEVEHEHPLSELVPDPAEGEMSLVADFAVFGKAKRLAIMLAQEPTQTCIREHDETVYALAGEGWRILSVDATDEASIARCIVTAQTLLLDPLSELESIRGV